VSTRRDPAVKTGKYRGSWAVFEENAPVVTGLSRDEARYHRNQVINRRAEEARKRVATCEYEWIRKWGRMLGSYQYYIDDQIALARREQAPANAVHKNQDGRWVTTDEITNVEARFALGLPL
jgi:hypothetical protein